MTWFEISKIPTAVKKSKFIVSFIIIFGTRSFAVWVHAGVQISSCAVNEPLDCYRSCAAHARATFPWRMSKPTLRCRVREHRPAVNSASWPGARSSFCRLDWHRPAQDRYPARHCPLHRCRSDAGARAAVEYEVGRKWTRRTDEEWHIDRARAKRAANSGRVTVGDWVSGESLWRWHGERTAAQRGCGRPPPGDAARQRWKGREQFRIFFLRKNYILVYIEWNDVTESMVTIRSPFCGYDLA